MNETANEAVPVLRTQGLTLRSFLPEDDLALYKIYQTENVLKYFPDPTPPTLEKVEKFIAGQQAHWQKFGYGNWGTLVGDCSEIVGWAGLQYLPELNETEVGFLLDRPYWGRGYATEAAQEALQFGFEKCNLDHIIALVHAENRASRRVIEKCGLVYTGTLLIWGIELMRYYINNPL
jgi:ribosomal-protein-alanine N-acetyltransferase